LRFENFGGLGGGAGCACCGFGGRELAGFLEEAADSESTSDVSIHGWIVSPRREAFSLGEGPLLHPEFSVLERLAQSLKKLVLSTVYPQALKYHVNFRYYGTFLNKFLCSKQ
jgi:hypothetical protein